MFQIVSKDPKTGLYIVNNRFIKDPKEDLWLLNALAERALNRSPLKHHSTTDWDFYCDRWQLDTEDFVSAPSCLTLEKGDPLASNALWCKHSVTGAVTEGRLVTQLKWYTSPAFPYLLFRGQDPDGEASVDAGYYLVVAIGSSLWSPPGVSYINEIPDAGTWANYRVTWWEGKNLQNDPATVCRVEKYIDPDWTQMGVDMYDTERLNKDSSINRVGLGRTSCATIPAVRFDDTEIWG
ncbi:hypothetical protein ES703_15805 [subsurface metagenome]